MNVSIAHLSDPHITTGAPVEPPAAGLSRALGRVLDLDPAPQCVVITGDLVHRGTADEYRALRGVIGRFPLPVHLVAGNHDDCGALVDEFGGTGFLGGGREAHYVVEAPAFTLAVLDSKVPGSPGGRLGPVQLAWLDKVLARSPGLPAFVALHHPPIPIGIPYLDEMRLEDGSELEEVLFRHGHVARVLAGHVHRPVSAAFGGTTVTTAPSTYRQSGLLLRDGPPGFWPDPASFLLHLRTGTTWVTHAVPVGRAAARGGAAGVSEPEGAPRTR